MSIESSHTDSIEQKKENEYLHSGEQTIITERIRRIAETVEGGFEEKIQQIFNRLSVLKHDTENKDEIFRKRTADQILGDGYVTGCTDDVLVFIALARAAGIPSKYIEAIDKKWMDSETPQIRGHVYAETFDNNKWRMIDSTQRKIDANIDEDGRVVYGEGLDSWDLGIRDYDSLKQHFVEFRKLRGETPQ